LIRGLRSLLSALGLIRARPRLLLFLMFAPWGLNTILFLGSWSALALYLTGKVAPTLNALVNAWWSPLLTGFGYFIAVLVAGALAYVVTVIGALCIGAPFLDKLSAEAERLAFPDAADLPGRMGILPALREGAKTAAALLCLEAAFLLLYLVPVAGPVLFALASAYVLTLGLLDIPLARRELTLKAKARFVVANTGAVLGIGAVVLAVSAVPFLNLLAVPVLVIAATLLVAEAEALKGTAGRARPPGAGDPERATRDLRRRPAPGPPRRT
jgi:CysZ protein